MDDSSRRGSLMPTPDSYDVEEKVSYLSTSSLKKGTRRVKGSKSPRKEHRTAAALHKEHMGGQALKNHAAGHKAPARVTKKMAKSTTSGTKLASPDDRQIKAADDGVGTRGERQSKAAEDGGMRAERKPKAAEDGGMRAERKPKAAEDSIMRADRHPKAAEDGAALIYSESFMRLTTRESEPVVSLHGQLREHRDVFNRALDMRLRATNEDIDVIGREALLESLYTSYLAATDQMTAREKNSLLRSLEKRIVTPSFDLASLDTDAMYRLTLSPSFLTRVTRYEEEDRVQENIVTEVSDTKRKSHGC
ncbi:hypothetical protein Btru_047701 [Bulinus truncatus]|nr:hypothetical protein Btru_047701 [Bulinus truncatus]